MAAARLAAALLVATLPSVCAQQPSPLLTVQVTDAAGAALPGALVDIGDGCSDPMGGETDQQGKLNFELSPGAHYHLAATSPGFCPAWQAIEIPSQPAQSIPIKLEAGACPNSCAPPCVPADSPPQMKSAQGRLDVQVADVRGTAIPEAQIETDPSSPAPGPVLSADSNGRASLKLPAGTHILSITAPGFDRWTHQLDVQAASNRTIVAALQTGLDCQPVVTTRTELDVPLWMPDPVSISPQPMQSLSPLPLQNAKKRW